MIKTVKRIAFHKSKHWLFCLQDAINSLSDEELRSLVLQQAEVQPRLWINEISRVQTIREETPEGTDLSPQWCSCGNCRQMEIQKMDVCCGKLPLNCHTLDPMFTEGCLSQFALEIGQICYANFRAQAPRFNNENLRFIAYRNYIAWIHGKLGKGNRKPVPSCCVLKIRKSYPDPNNRYVLYKEWEGM